MCLAPVDASAKIVADESIRVVFVPADGPVFRAGADLKERAGKDDAWVRERRMTWEPKTLGQLLARQAADRGKHEAIVTPERRITYEDLYLRAGSAACTLHSLGIRRGDHVGILMGNDEKWLALFYGAALIGAVTVPVDTRFKAAEIACCATQADCKALFYVPKFLNIDFRAMVKETGLKNAFDITRALPEWDVSTGDAPSSPGDPLLLQFTSGSTAHPKGVLLTHDNMLRDAWEAGARIGIRPEDRYFDCQPFFHVAGSTLSALMALVSGATLVTLPAFEAGAALELMERERCTLVSGNDTIFQMLMDHQDFPKRKLCLRGGWAAAGPQTMRKTGRSTASR